MKVGLYVVLLSILGCGIGGVTARAQDTKQPSKLVVHVNYTGAGKVDAKHKIFVVLWDSPDFVSGGGEMPVDIVSTASNDSDVTFSNVKKVPAYVSTVFDPKGEWDAQSGPPPEGSSLGLYMKTPGKPEPIDIAPGKPATIAVTFDDSIKMGEGGPK